MLTNHVTAAKPMAPKLLAEHPHDPEVLYLSGIVDRTVGDYPQAKEHLEAAVALDPNFFNSRYNLGMVLVFLHEWKEASEQLEKAIALGATEPQVHFELAKALRGALCPVHEEGLVGREGLMSLDPRQPLLHQIFCEMVFLTLRWFNRVEVFVEPRFPLRGFTGEEAIKIVEPMTGGPAIEYVGQYYLERHYTRGAARSCWRPCGACAPDGWPGAIMRVRRDERPDGQGRRRTQAVRTPGGAEGGLAGGAAGRGYVPARPVRLGQVDLPALYQPPGEDQRRSAVR